MALNLSKLKNTVQPENNANKTNFSKLNLSGLKKQAESNKDSVESTTLNGLNLSQVTQPKPEAVKPGFSLSFTEGKNYDLDQIVAEKRRDNENAPIFLQASLGPVFEKTMAELVAKKILSDYNIPYSDSNYKTEINKIPNFSRIFDVYANKYYRIYVGMDTLTYPVSNEDKFNSIIGMKYYPIVDGNIQVLPNPLIVSESDKEKLIGTKIALKNDVYEGSISLDTVFQQASISSSDVKKYTLEDVYEADKQGKFLSYTDRYRPMIIWTDGTPDPGQEDTSIDKSDVDSENLSYWIAEKLKTNTALSINKNIDGIVYIDIDYKKLAEEYSAGSADYFKEIAEIAAINAELARLREIVDDISSLIGEDVLAANIKVSYSKYLYDARPLEKETNYLNIELPLDISADDLIYYGETLYSRELPNLSLELIMENPRDYKVVSLEDGTNKLIIKRDDVLMASINPDKSYDLLLADTTMEELENGSLELLASNIRLS